MVNVGKHTSPAHLVGSAVMPCPQLSEKTAENSEETSTNLEEV